MIADCTACGRKVWFPDESAGKREKCFYCGREMLVTKSFARTENFLGLIAYDAPVSIGIAYAARGTKDTLERSLAER